MEPFQSVVITVGGVLLLVILVFIGFSLYRRKGDTAYPPVLASCPDYWQDLSTTGSKGGSNCLNIQNLGLNTGVCNKKSDFSAMTTCEKATWSKQCNITWDGITDNDDICQSGVLPAAAFY